ncbi:lipopolysaccharide biosynthesis protein [Erythrobacter sp. NFXS35]|uniref:lipopolysaccharide biosynthesis protein n=1 Tax=Erythrobacter sp. NFXS35 TaxID=2818436 RepID=UPI0032DF0A7A
MSSDKRRPIIKGALWLGSGRVIVNAIGFVSTLVLARLLSPADFGLVALAEAVFAIASAVTEMSLAQSLVQHRKPEDHHYHTAFTLNLGRSLLLGLFIAAIAVPVAQGYGDDRLRDVLLVLAVAAAFGSLENPKLVTFQRNLIFWQDFLLSVAAKLTGLLVALGIALVYQSYWALVLGSLAAQVLRVGLSYAVIPYLPRLSLRGGRELLSFSGWLTLSNTLKTATWRFDPLVLGLVLPQAAVGHYTFGARLGSLPVKESLSPLRTLLFPALARMQDQPDRLRQAYLNAQAALVLIALPLGVGLAVLAEPLVLVAIGESWLPAVPVMQAIAILSAVQQWESSQPLGMALGATKSLFKRDMRVLAVRLPLVVAGLLIGQATPVGALVGVLAGRVAAGVFNVAVNIKLIEKLVNLSVAQQIGVAIRPALAAAMMAGALVFLKGFGLGEGSTEAIVVLGGFVAAGIATYIAAIMLLWTASGRPEGAEREVLRLMVKVFRARVRN